MFSLEQYIKEFVHGGPVDGMICYCKLCWWWRCRWYDLLL